MSRDLRLLMNSKQFHTVHTQTRAEFSFQLRQPLATTNAWDRADIKMYSMPSHAKANLFRFLSICFSLILSLFLRFTLCLSYSPSPVDLNCVTEINFNVSCTQSSREPREAFLSISFPSSGSLFFGIFLLLSLLFTSLFLFFLRSSLLWIALRKEQKCF